MNCSEDVCVTCSDAAEAAVVVDVLGDGLALVETDSARFEVSLELVEAGVGDTVLVHAGVAIRVLS